MELDSSTGTDFVRWNGFCPLGWILSAGMEFIWNCLPVFTNVFFFPAGIDLSTGMEFSLILSTGIESIGFFSLAWSSDGGCPLGWSLSAGMEFVRRD